MKLHVAFIALFVAVKRNSAQQIGNFETEEKPTITLKECTINGGCTSKQAKLTLDANWRWIHDVSGPENCYTGDSWDSGKCSDPVTCAKNCALEGVTKAKYESTYGVKQVEDGVRLNFVTNHEHGTNVGSRLYVMEDDENYAMFYLKNREFSFEVDVSELYCGMNGAMYFSEMEANGGKGIGDNNAGAKYGTGYCDAQCPHDIKFIDGEANVIDWEPNPNDQDGNMGAGKYGACCAEMDIWEANSMATAYTPHTCSVEKLYRCEGIECGDNAAGQRYDGVCDKDGCDINPYRMGNTDFYGRGEEYPVNTLKPMTVVTQFLTTDGTDSGDLSEIRRFYVQDGNVVHSPPSTILGPGKDTDSITDQFCDDKKDLFGDVKDYQEHGGMKGMGESLDRGHVMIFSLWDDVEVNMLWLDAAYPLNRPETDPGIKRGDCPGGVSSTPTYLRDTYPSGGVVFKNAAVGEIGSTYQPPAPTPPTATPAPISSPQCDGPTGCCSQDFASCVTWCGTSKDQCLSCGQDVHWICGPQSGCKSRWNDCTNDKNGCCDGLTCVDVNPGYSQCQYVAGPPPTPQPVNPTPNPTPLPTSQPITNPTSQPITNPTPPPVPSNNNGLFSTDNTLTSWDALQEIDSLTNKVQTNPPLYALIAGGGAAGSGNVVSEGQAYGLLISSIVLASWETHSASNANADWNLAVNYFEGYFNGWKKMCLNSNPDLGCQWDGQWCEDQSTGQSGICLPGWKFSGDLSSEVGTGAAPDGDEDAIVAMILAIKAFEGKAKPSWYNELRKWTDASCTSFLKYNTVVKNNHRLVKLGSCWGGWGNDGNNPSYHSPGSYKVMRDFHTSFPEDERDYAMPSFGSGSLEDHWNQLIDTSYEAISATQCPAQGMVPNWATVDIVNNEIRHTGGTFSGSGTPQWEYGAEAARTTWRVTIDAALFPSEMGVAAKPYLNPVLSTLESGYNPNLSLSQKYFDTNTFNTCQIPGVSTSIYSFSSGWVWNNFIFSPTVSSLVVPIDGVTEAYQQSMIDQTGAALASGISNLDYYPRCWTVIGILTVNGAVESAGQLLASPGTPSASPVATPTSNPVATPTSPPTTAGCYSKNYKHCLPDGYTSDADTCGVIWLPDGEQTNCLALWAECGSSSDCCGEAVCFGDNDYATCVPPSDDPDTPAPSKNPTPLPTPAPTPLPTDLPTPVPCIVCDDVETPRMTSTGRDCTRTNLVNTKCNKSNFWITNKWCRLSCYNAGNGYPGDVCCSSSSRMRNLREASR